jgi:YVTN family beta-propeller protein
MINISGKQILKTTTVGLLFGLGSCSSSMHVHKTVANDALRYQSPYDTGTLAADNGSVLMPYNRFVDPAGTVIRFGNPSAENHSLDCVLLPNQNVLAVEDRYGLAMFDVAEKKLLYHLDYDGEYKGLKSTFSGIKTWQDGNTLHLFWGAANPTSKASFIMDAVWNGQKAVMQNAIKFAAREPAPMSLPNDIALNKENGEDYLYVVLNGNNEIVKMRLKDRSTVWTAPTGMAPYGVVVAASKVYVTNWAGTVPTDAKQPVAGIPYSNVYIDPRTGATASGTVSVVDPATGKTEKEINVGLHPTAIISSPDNNYLYVTNGNSDNVSVIRTATNSVVDSISVKLNRDADFIGDSPNALALDKSGTRLYVSNGLDNAIAVVKLGKKSAEAGSGTSSIAGFIPTEAYPAGLVVTNETLYVCNLEGEGARVLSKNGGSNCHNQEATISIISMPDAQKLVSYTDRVKAANLFFRTKLSQMLPRKGIAARPVPERIGEPSVFKHVLYIIKENKTYDQVLGDMPEGAGMKSLCIYGAEITPNAHKLAKDYLLLDNFYASGKSSAEGHSWANAAMVTDYVEKNVNAWFRSYPHVLADALVYSKEGFLWNNALDHGKTVRVYGEACKPRWKDNASWTEIYRSYLNGKPIAFTNTTTISRLEPILSPSYPGFDGPASTDQIKADAFIKELKQYEALPGDQLPQLMVMALPADHTVGMREGFPTPRAMVADNDLALGRIMEALTKSRFWDSTVVFVVQDDPQSGWDHVSAYRTVGFVMSPYSLLSKTIHTNYNQTCIVRTIEQILGIPPMNVVDATALPMFDCFADTPQKREYVHLKNNIPLDEMNKAATALKGKAKQYAELSALPMFDTIDGGDDDLLNHILWYSAMGNKPYPKNMTLPKSRQKDDDDD